MTRPLRILIATDACTPAVGGVQTFLTGLCAQLSARGHRVSLVCAPGQTAPHPDVDVIAALPLAAPAGELELAAMGEALGEYALAVGADVVLCATAGLALYAPFIAAPVVVVVHGKDLLAPWQRVPDREARAEIARAVDRCAARVVVSAAVRRIALARGVVRPCDVVEPGFDDAFFLPGPSERARLDVSEDDFAIAIVARLAARKGHVALMDALARAGIPRARLLVVGDGDLRDALEAHARARHIDARFLGALSRVDVRAVLRSVDAHVLAPHTVSDERGDDVEGFGLSVLEAAACGTPSIGTRSGGVSEAIEDGVSGVLVPEGDVDTLAQALRALASDAGLRRRLAAGARRRARRHGGHARCADQIEAVLARAAETREGVPLTGLRA